MGHSGWFRLEDAGNEWLGFRTLALVCTRARVTNLQAQVLLLWCRGLTYPEITTTLSLKDRSIARKTFLGGSRRIAELLPPPPNNQADDWASDILHCFRNLHSGRTPGDRDTFTKRGAGDHCSLTRDFYTCSWDVKPGSPRLVTPADLEPLAADWDPEAEFLLWLDDLRQAGPTVRLVRDDAGELQTVV